MAYSAYAVANAFIQRAKEGKLPKLTPMKLQKLLYFAQAWHLKGTGGKPLLDDNFARWRHGPVIPAIYHEFKAYGYDSISQMATTLAVSEGGYSMNVPTIPDDDRSAWGLIDAIIGKYGQLGGIALSNMTHLTDSAWDGGGRGGDGSVITQEEIRNDKTVV
jgi:uncharacterized phage-associated protein